MVFIALIRPRGGISVLMSSLSSPAGPGDSWTLYLAARGCHSGRPDPVSPPLTLDLGSLGESSAHQSSSSFILPHLISLLRLFPFLACLHFTAPFHAVSCEVVACWAPLFWWGRILTQLKHSSLAGRCSLCADMGVKSPLAAPSLPGRLQIHPPLCPAACATLVSIQGCGLHTGYVFGSTEDHSIDRYGQRALFEGWDDGSGQVSQSAIHKLHTPNSQRFGSSASLLAQSESRTTETRSANVQGQERIDAQLRRSRFVPPLPSCSTCST